MVMIKKMFQYIHKPSYLPQAEAVFRNLQAPNFPTEPSNFPAEPPNFPAGPPRNRQKPPHNHKDPPPNHSPTMKVYEGTYFSIILNTNKLT